MWIDVRNNAGVLELPLRGPAGAAGVNGLWSNTALAKTALYTVGNGDKGKTINASSGPYTITINAAGTYDADFGIVIANTDPLTKTGQVLDGRGILIAVSGHDSFWLYPGQTTTIRRVGSVHRIERDKRWIAPKGTTNIYCNHSTGSDTANDGLRSTSPFQTLQQALGWILNDVDPWGHASSVTRWEIHMAAGVVSDPGAHFSPHALVGGQGGQYVRVVFGAGAGITAVTGSCFELYYGLILQIQGGILVAAAGSCITAERCKVFVGGTQFGTAQTHIRASNGADVELMDDIEIVGDYEFYHVDCGNGGRYNQQGWDTLVTVNCSGIGWAIAQRLGIVSYAPSGSSITLETGVTVTGLRGQTLTNGVIQSQTGAPNTFFPGNSNGTTASGGQFV